MQLFKLHTIRYNSLEMIFVQLIPYIYEKKV